MASHPFVSNVLSEAAVRRRRAVNESKGILRLASQHQCVT